jgi:hypothetical protein
MRTGLSIALALSLSIPPRPALAGELSREQLATLDRLIALENLNKFTDAYDLAVQEFRSSAAHPDYRRSIINRGQVIAVRRYDDTKDVTYLCTALEMLRVYQAELIVSEEDRLDIGPALELLEVRATEAAAPCARPSPPPRAPAGSGDKVPGGASVGDGPPTSAPPVFTRPEGPAPAPAPAARRSRTQIAVGASLMATEAGLAAGLAGCFVASGQARDRIAAIGDEADEAGRGLTTDEWMEAAAADTRALRLTRTGTALGVFAVASVIAGIVVLARPPKATSRLHARPAGAGIRFQF